MLQEQQQGQKMYFFSSTAPHFRVWLRQPSTMEKNGITVNDEGEYLEFDMDCRYQTDNPNIAEHLRKKKYIGVRIFEVDMNEIEQIRELNEMPVELPEVSNVVEMKKRTKEVPEESENRCEFCNSVWSSMKMLDVHRAKCPEKKRQEEGD
jgi:hypothetical protein